MRKFSDAEYDDVLLIGDSIMEGTSNVVKQYLPGATIDAKASRSLERGGTAEGFSNNDGVLDHVRGSDRNFNRYIIGTGNNDGNGMSIKDGEEIISELKGKEIWFVTEFVSNNLNGTNNTNNTIDYLCDKYNFVHKVDWYNVVRPNKQHYLGSDNCHPINSAAMNAYASILKESLDYP